jgi:hypothetical protein
VRRCWRNAVSHPDEKVAAAARDRLRILLPKEAKLEAAWVEANVDRLRWDEATRTCRP